MKAVFQYLRKAIAQCTLQASLRAAFVIPLALLTNSLRLCAQCPNTGETKVFKAGQGTGYYFYKFLGDSSFRYFLDGETFKYNEKDDPGKTFVFIDDFAYETTLASRADIAKYEHSSRAIDLLRAQAKHQQAYFKSVLPAMVITEYGPSARKNPDGSNERLFYLWKKDNPPKTEAATQYLVSTLINDGVFVLSIMLQKTSISEDDVFSQIEKYTSRFDLLTSEQCAKALSAPIAR